MHKRVILSLFVALWGVGSVAAQEVVTDSLVANPDAEVMRINKDKLEKADYLPEIHSTLRSKFEYQPQMGAGRFQVRTARVSITGNVLPILGYKAEVDLCDQGEIKMLDAYIRLFPCDGLSLTLGQNRIPFTIDAQRSPHTQLFANRSFLAKEVGNIRDVGFTASYKLPIKMPITLEAGVYNGKGLYNQKEAWTKDFCYVGKFSFGFVPGMNFVLSALTIKPREHRVYAYDAGVSYNIWRFLIEGEYMYKHYEDVAFTPVHTGNAVLSYKQPLPKVFDAMDIRARYDYMSNHWDGKTYDGHKAVMTDSERHRLTAGITLTMSPFQKENPKTGKAFSRIAQNFVMELRVNYEKYFYTQPNLAQADEQDKLVAEVSLRF